MCNSIKEEGRLSPGYIVTRELSIIILARPRIYWSGSIAQTYPQINAQIYAQIYAQITEREGRDNIVHISSPITETSSKSTPVCRPAYRRAKRTFSVHTFPTGFIEYGQPPKPPTEESTVLQPQ